MAGALAAVSAGLGLALVQTGVAAVFGTDLSGGDDLWLVPSTYLRLVEGLSFALLLAPVSALVVWAVPRLPRFRSAWVGMLACLTVAAVAVGLGAERFTGVPPLAQDIEPVALPSAPQSEDRSALGFPPLPGPDAGLPPLPGPDALLAGALRSSPRPPLLPASAGRGRCRPCGCPGRSPGSLAACADCSSIALPLVAAQG